MALKATVYKANVNIADMDRHHYQDADLVIAQHPSETELRMMVRLLAWIRHADERLSFTKGLCAEDEPEIWVKNYHGGIDLWIDVGLPDEKRLKKAVNQSEQVVLYTYSERAARVWWEQNKRKLKQYANLSVYFISDEQAAALSSYVQRTMHIQATIEDGVMWFSDATKNSQIEYEKWQ
ncbi:MAG: YaeQ family protein [Plesiomonas sp.]